VLLLRAAGVPARYVTGFRGGEWNPIGGYVAVRGERAHAWAEAFVDGSGWTRVDATPPAEAPGRAGRPAQTRDALDLFWSRWVVGSGLGRQRALAHHAWRELGHFGPSTPPGQFLLALAVASILVVVALGVRRAGRRRGLPIAVSAAGLGASTRPRSEGAIDRLYRRTLGRLDRLGWPRRPNETPHEDAPRPRAAGPVGATDAA